MKMTFSEIKEAVVSARAAARKEAHRNCGRGFLFSRGSSLRAVDAKGDLVLGEAESWSWDGTKRDLERAVEEAKQAGAVELSIEGGWDWAATMQDKTDGAHDPWVGEWAVIIWKEGE